MTVLEGDIGRIWWFDELQEPSHASMWGIGWVSFLTKEPLIVGGTRFLCIPVFELDTRRIYWPDKFEILDMWECVASEELILVLATSQRWRNWISLNHGLWRRHRKDFVVWRVSRNFTCKDVRHWRSFLLDLLTSQCWRLNIYACRFLREIYEGFGGLMSLRELVMQTCEAFKEFPFGLSKFFSFARNGFH